jgi:hypothetical protein
VTGTSAYPPYCPRKYPSVVSGTILAISAKFFSFSNALTRDALIGHQALK